MLDKLTQRALGNFSAVLVSRNNSDAKEVAVESEREQPSAFLVVTFHVTEQKLTKTPVEAQRLTCDAVCQNILVAVQTMGYLEHDEVTQLVGLIFVGSVETTPNERPRSKFDADVRMWAPLAQLTFHRRNRPVCNIRPPSMDVC